MAAARRSSKARDIAFGGITVALIVLSLYAVTIIKNNTIFFLALSNYLSGIPYIKGHIKSGLKVYAASIILAIITISDKIYIIAYAVTGLYPLIKLLCESRTVVLEFILKFLYYNVSMLFLVFAYDKVMNTVMLSLLWPLSSKTIIIIVLAELLFLVYDLVFSKFINFVRARLMGGII